MSNHFPITPPPELVQQWESRIFDEQENVDVLLIEAYKAGADQELEACCEWLENQTLCVHRELIPSLRRLRRPRPPSLKEQALSELNLTADPDGAELSQTQVELIRRALEALND